MPAPGSARAPEVGAIELEKNEAAGEKQERSDALSRWQIWKQVLIAELLNVLERRRYDAPGMK